jgi:hypothetical protein
MGNWSSQSSHGSSVSPFGNLPFKLSRMGQRNFSTPLSEGFGFNPSSSFEGSLATASGPTADFIRQGRENMAGYLPSLRNVSNQISTGATRAYGGYQAAVDQFMSQLQGFQNTVGTATGGAEDALGYARTNAEDAFSALPGRATYQEASQRMLAPAREGAAARGMLESGQAQAGEQNMLSDLAYQTLQSDQANRQAAVEGLGGASSNLANMGGLAAQVASMGPQMQQALFSAFPQLAQMLTGAAQLPMEGQNQLLQFLTAAQDPNFSLLRMVLPQVTTASQGNSAGILNIS